MKVRAQVSMVFHLDKCIGCHTCSIACKNVWTDRKGAEYMWWNNVETKPGTGYPSAWEDQDRYQGGFVAPGGNLELRSGGKTRELSNLFHNPNLPVLDDYYEPWTYRYQDLFDAPAGDDQPIARAVSAITGKPMEIEAGPNWDDDLSGSPIYAANDPNREKLSESERQQMFAIEKLVFFYLPRICNHCLNPACVASCPSGALYKRGEDGIVLLNQERCRAWRFCVSACPYKKSYYNWSGGKSEKCVLCYPRLETGQAPACFHSCVGRIRYLGVVLYDADRIEATAKLPDLELAQGHRDLILDPEDPEVLKAARKEGIPPMVIDSARRSPVYKFVKIWKLALPLHIEFRTLPMLFYVPPLLPILGKNRGGAYDTTSEDFFGLMEEARLPIRYLASLFAAGNEGLVRHSLQKLMAVRLHRRQVTVGDLDAAKVAKTLNEADLTSEQAEAIYRLTSLPLFDERFVIPPMMREQAIEAMNEPDRWKGETGLGFRKPPERGL